MEQVPFRASSIGLKACPRLGSKVSCQKKKVVAPHTKSSDSSWFVQVVMVGVTSADKQLDQIAQVIVKLTKTIKEKDMQITSLMSKLKERHVRESSKGERRVKNSLPQECVVNAWFHFSDVFVNPITPRQDRQHYQSMIWRFFSRFTHVLQVLHEEGW